MKSHPDYYNLIKTLLLFISECEYKERERERESLLLPNPPPSTFLVLPLPLPVDRTICCGVLPAVVLISLLLVLTFPRSLYFLCPRHGFYSEL